MKKLKDSDPPTEGELALILQRWPLPHPEREYQYPELDQVTTLHRLVAEVRRLRGPGANVLRFSTGKPTTTHGEPFDDHELLDIEDGAHIELQKGPGCAVHPDDILRLVSEVRQLRCELHDAKMEAAFWAPHGAECAHCHGLCGREHPEAPPR